ncbi:aminoglycoside phosphotransferase family protein [Yokenella regensburgei]|uniref:aminoglycoside phosphotransferase family protein n=1 Tax=Yokenella regensburgei TaxID=158877 RepID=UPI0002420C23|nr:aminoglycoside phosphotransferase family protein [Yokenella regensburgei]EHM46292.1 Aminoglycoside/hydroxyurea antibiotic resistance kinase [Yokenella regensburgei ATCC 43003]
MTPVPFDFTPYLKCWQLTPDGAAIATHSSSLLPVIYAGEKAMLKVAHTDEEIIGSRLLQAWQGNGAARVFRRADNAVLLERATGGRSLVTMVEQGQDAQASVIICQTVAQLHHSRPGAIPELTPLNVWFAALLATPQHGILALCARTAAQLLQNPEEEIALHGDIHHGNILDFSGRGWLAIDPKGLFGERGFDYANLFCNPSDVLSGSAERLASQVMLVAKQARLEPSRLLQWIIAWSGLSAVWFLEDGETRSATARLRVATNAAEKLAQMSS